MRRTVGFVCVVLFVAGAAGAFAAGIVGTAHDFSSETWSEGRICLPCHVPHNAQMDEDGTSLVLWNHRITNETFTMYTDFSVERADRDRDEQPAGPSKLCLSCHDGVTAVDAFGGGPDAPSIFAIESSLGTDLTDDHPIGVQYPADGFEGFKPRANLPPLKLISWGSKVDRVECTSCHEPHADDFGMFLRMDNTGSSLCLQCHDK
ncbi:MAG: cytochrome c3 family protein [Phycisphaerae bacterium]|jgi:predicted CXXCH cytochrome family protein